MVWLTVTAAGGVCAVWYTSGRQAQPHWVTYQPEPPQQCSTHCIATDPSRRLCSPSTFQLREGRGDEDGVPCDHRRAELWVRLLSRARARGSGGGRWAAAGGGEGRRSGRGHGRGQALGRAPLAYGCRRRPWWCDGGRRGAPTAWVTGHAPVGPGVSDTPTCMTGMWPESGGRREAHGALGWKKQRRRSSADLGASAGALADPARAACMLL